MAHCNLDTIKSAATPLVVEASPFSGHQEDKKVSGVPLLQIDDTQQYQDNFQWRLAFTSAQVGVATSYRFHNSDNQNHIHG